MSPNFARISVELMVVFGRGVALAAFTHVCSVEPMEDAAAGATLPATTLVCFELFFGFLTGSAARSGDVVCFELFFGPFGFFTDSATRSCDVVRGRVSVTPGYFLKNVSGSSSESESSSSAASSSKNSSSEVIRGCDDAARSCEAVCGRAAQ